MPESDLMDLREGMTVVTDDSQPIGEILEVFRDLGLIESFGEKGIPPQQEGHDPVNYDYSEAMPGAGDSYFTVKKRDGQVLYLPFAAVSATEGDRAVVAVDAANLPDMGWDVRPDALTAIAHEYPEDGGADPQKA
jgi:hypothetical protein